MNAIENFLRSLSSKERQAMLLLLQQIKKDPLKIPGIVSLQGMKGWYRVRMGRYRIIFVVDARKHTVEIRRITKRNEGTYKNL